MNGKTTCSAPDDSQEKELLAEIENLTELIDYDEATLSDDFLICECYCVSVKDIREVCEQLGSFDLKTVQDRFGLGKGCQSCLKFIDNVSFL
jgi:NAD(P)H-nitrite reductase large subunit